MRTVFRDRTVVVSGAASGIGRALGLALAQQGARLALIDLKPTALDAELASAARAYQADVGDAARMHQVTQQILADFGAVDVVIASAGVGGLNPGYAFSAEVHARTTAVNVLGLVHTLAPFVPGMVQRRRGHLVGISSLASFRGLPNAGSYSSTKAAQRVLLESLRVDLRPLGVAVTCICPGFVQTPMTEHDEFPMPFMVPVDRAARLILRAVERQRALYLFPWQMRWLTYVNRLLPPALFDRLIPRLSQATLDKRARVF